MNSDLTYKKELNKIQVAKSEKDRLAKEEHNQKLRDLNLKYNIVPKEKASLEELVSMIKMVLEGGKTGTTAIKEYAEIHFKTDKWRKEVAKPRVTATFKTALGQFKKHIVVLAMKSNNVYVERDILNNTVTGALTKLSKQLQVSKVIDDLREEVATLKTNLANKLEGKDWKPEALRLKTEEGMSIRDIAERVGMSSSVVGAYLKGK